MYLGGKYIHSLVGEDLVRLIEDDVKESESLDYKRELNIADDKSKNRQEFVSDICAMYNTRGGCIVYGVEERKDESGRNTGYPSELVNQLVENIDALELQIQNIIRSNTDPSITNVAVRLVTANDLQIVVVGVPRRLGLPAMVRYNDVNRFYKRNSTGKYIVTTQELYQMFLQNQTIKEKADDFRIKRIQLVRTEQVIPGVATGGGYFIHIIPFGFLENDRLDLTNLESSQISQLAPVAGPMDSGSGWDFIYNLDGFLTFRNDRLSAVVNSYNQYFRNGIIEVYSSAFSRFDSANSRSFYEHEIIRETF